MEASGPPHEAPYLVLPYLPLYELLTITQVSRSLRDAVADDVLIWLDILVQSPLNLRLTDDILMRITSKVGGRLRNLVLVNCVNITDDGLLRVVAHNPLIIRLYVPGCTSLTPTGVLHAVQTLTETTHCLTTIKISGIYNINQHHLTLLQSHLSTSQNQQQSHTQKPQYYQNSHTTLFIPDLNNDARPIDVEICPRCNEVKIVFDCPREISKGTHRGCHGCCHCIERCIRCGVCIEDDEQEETVCGCTLCVDCWLRLPKCSLCNKPFCGQHENEGHVDASGSIEFACGVCDVNCTQDWD